MKPKYTPGPWFVYTVGNAKGFGICTERTEKMEVNITTGTSIPRAADARLIAAAPELLEALRWCIAALNSRGIDSSTGELDRAKEVLAKATGGAE